MEGCVGVVETYLGARGDGHEGFVGSVEGEELAFGAMVDVVDTVDEGVLLRHR